MLTRRIIPCLDVKQGKVVKGVRFRDHVVMGEIEELALRYRDAGADELVFYDITASPEARGVEHSWVGRVAQVIDIPFCVAGGIRSVADARAVLHAGADKISINSPALERPQLIDELAAAFGVQCIVVGIDSLRDADGEWRVRQYSGDPDKTRALPQRTLDWAAEAVARGAGEIVLNCMGSDGVRQGFDLEQLACVRRQCPVPLIASGGAGTHEHFADVFAQADVDGALAASVFHSATITIGDLKHYLREQGDSGAPMTSLDADSLDWAKGDGLLPAIVQHHLRGSILMQGWMNAPALQSTQESGKVTFYSRSKQRLWTKGESSGHWLLVRGIATDCDRDAILIQAEPQGPTCHLGTPSCFGAQAVSGFGFLAELDALVAQRERERPAGSYTSTLFGNGLRHIAQKVGEEGVETALAAVVQDDAALTGEAADLLFHLTVLLRARGLSLAAAIQVLEQRHR